MISRRRRKFQPDCKITSAITKRNGLLGNFHERKKAIKCQIKNFEALQENATRKNLKEIAIKIENAMADTEVANEQLEVSGSGTGKRA